MIVLPSRKVLKVLSWCALAILNTATLLPFVSGQAPASSPSSVAKKRQAFSTLVGCLKQPPEAVKRSGQGSSHTYSACQNLAVSSIYSATAAFALMDLASASTEGPAIAALLDCGIDPNIRNSSGFGPIHVAVEAGNNHAVNALLSGKNKVDPNLETFDGRRPQDILMGIGSNEPKYREISVSLQREGGVSGIHYCPPEGDPERIKCKLLQALRQGKVNESSFLEMALHEAVEKDASLDVIVKLIEAGAKLDAYDNESGLTPLHKAASAGRFQTVAILRIKGAALNLRTQKTNKTAVDLAKTKRRYRVVDYLLHFGGRTSSCLAQFGPGDLKDLDSHGKSRLHSAVLKNDLKDVARLLACGADPHAPDLEGNMAIHEAVTARFPEVVEELLKAGVDPDVRNKDGWTPLHLAVARTSNFHRLLEILVVKYGADVNLKTADDARVHPGMTALDLALDVFGHGYGIKVPLEALGAKRAAELG